MSSLALPVHVPWGDRTSLLSKRMLYVLSFDLVAEATGSTLMIDKKASNEAGGLRNQFGDTVITMPEGLRCDLPKGEIVHGSGEIGKHDDPASSQLEMQVLLDLGPSGKVLADCPGVVTFEGGPEAFRSTTAETLRGSAFIATRHETTSTAFRWLNRRQLYGVGRVYGHRPSGGQWKLRFTFDLYAGF